MTDKYIVYEHIFPNNKRYIGITCRSPKKRWKGGKYGYLHNRYMINAISKYGWENVKHNILFEDLTKEEAENKEIELIAEFDLTNREKGYNIETGGKSANRITEETRLLLHQKCSGKNNARYGVEVSLETREKMRKAKLGKKEPYSQRYNKMVSSGRRTLQFSLDGKFIKEWYSAREASRQCHCNVYQCCNGHQKTAGGYIWKYKES